MRDAGDTLFLSLITLWGKAVEDYRSPRRFATEETVGKSAKFWSAPVLPPSQRARAPLRRDGGWHLGRGHAAADFVSANANSNSSQVVFMAA